MRNVTRPAITGRYCERFHEVPAREIRAGDVADLAGFDERVERFDGFIDGRGGIEAVHVIDVDAVGFQTLEALLAGANEVIAGGSDVVRAIAKAEGGFAGDKKLLAFALDSFA